MGIVCLKDSAHNRPLPLPSSKKSKRSSMTEEFSLPNIEPVGTMNFPKGPIKSEVSDTTSYYSCLTKKTGALIISRNTTNTNKPIEIASFHKEKMSIVILPPNDDQEERIPTEPFDFMRRKSKQRTEEAANNSGFFEAHSFFKDEDEQEPELILAKAKDSTFDVTNQSSEFCRQQTGVSESNIDSVSPNQRHENHMRLINEIEQVFIDMQEITEELLESFEKVYESSRGSHKLGIFLNYYFDQEGYRRIRVKADWYMPCSAEDCIRYINTFEGLSEIMKHAEHLEQCDSFEDLEDHEYAVYYTCVPGLPCTKPKDAVMLKTWRKLGKDRWCDVFKSIEDERHPEYESRMRMKVAMGGHLAYKEEGMEEKEKCKVRLYFEVLLENPNVENRIAKFLVYELKNYVERCVWSADRFSLFHSERTGIKHLDILL